MILKSDFINFAETVVCADKSILEIEKSFGDISLRNVNAFSLNSIAHKIAYWLFDFKDNKYFDSFTIDFWNIVDAGYSTIWDINKDGDEEKIILHDWNDFYNYWSKKEVE